MLISCKECGTEFELEDHLVKATGSKVRCSQCQNLFVVYPHDKENQPEDPEKLDDNDILEPEVAKSSADDDLDFSDLDDMIASEAASQAEDAGDDSNDLELDLDFDTDSQEAIDLDDQGLEEMDKQVKETSTATTDAVPPPPQEEKKEEPEFDLELDEKDEAIAEIEEVDELEMDDLDIFSEPTTDDDDSDDELADIDFDLDMEDEAEAETSDDDLDLAGLDLTTEGSDEEVLDNGLESDEVKLNLDIDSGDDDFDLGDIEMELDSDDDTEAANDDDLELELDDLSLDFDDDADDDTGDDDFELDDLDLGLEEEATEDEAQEDLNLDDLELELDGDDSDDKSQETVDEELQLDLEPSVDVDEDAADLGLNLDADGDDELDFSDLDQMIDEESQTDEENEPDGLEIELDIDDDDAPSLTEESADNSDELDFSDLEDMLDEEVAAQKDSNDDDLDALELELDLGGEDEEISSNKSSKDNDELDLSDIEDMLENDTPKKTVKSASGSGELELDLDDDSEELDISDIELSLDAEDAATTQSTNDNDELELEIDMDDNVLGGSSSEDDELEFESVEDASVKPLIQPIQEEEDAYAETQMISMRPRPIKKSSKKSPVFSILLVLIVLGGAGVLVLPGILGVEIPVVTEYATKIPYLKNLYAPAQPDAGNLKIQTLDAETDAKFVINTQAGKLFVITGKVKNEYANVRKSVSVTGSIYSSGMNLIQSEKIYCGNTISDSDLSTLDLDKIKMRLNNPAGDNNSNTNLEPDKTLPFMIVFGNLPETKTLDRYTVVSAGSKPVTGP